MTIEVIGAIAGVGGRFPGVFGASLFLGSMVSQVLIVSTVYGYNWDLEREADTSGYGRLIRADY